MRRNSYRRRTPRTGRQLLETRAPRRGTLIVAAVLYVVGLFGYLDWFPISDDLAVGMLALAGGLLLLGSLLRDL